MDALLDSSRCELVFIGPLPDRITALPQLAVDVISSDFHKGSLVVNLFIRVI